MAPSLIYLPNGQVLEVVPVFGGYSMNSHELNRHNPAFPSGWTVILDTEVPLPETDTNKDNVDDGPESRPRLYSIVDEEDGSYIDRSGKRVRQYTKPTATHDSLFISSIAMPPSSDFQKPTSRTRQYAMMLWATLWWYFHEPAPSLYAETDAALKLPEAARPKRDWRVAIKKEGIFKTKNLLQKFERMGLVHTMESCAGLDDYTGYDSLFASQRAFWQMDPRIYLFRMGPKILSPLPVEASPLNSRPASPTRGYSSKSVNSIDTPTGSSVATESSLEKYATALAKSLASGPGPFESNSHLPTYYPPPPRQYTYTDGVRHPMRRKPPHQGETCYMRYIPSFGQWLSFRLPSLSTKTTPPNVRRASENQSRHHHSSSSSGTSGAIFNGLNNFSFGGSSVPSSATRPRTAHANSEPPPPSILDLPPHQTPPQTPKTEIELTDLQILHKWMNNDRVNAFWGEAGPISHTENFLRSALTNKHSFPVFGCWDGVPFGYFEIYWVKEDLLGKHMPGGAADYDRGLHCLVGEDWARGQHRVKVWLDSLVHYCWLSDARVDTVMLEPRLDNEK